MEESGEEFDVEKILKKRFDANKVKFYIQNGK